jgi:hypothetical protein
VISVIFIVNNLNAPKQAVNKFCLLSDTCGKVPKLQGKKYADYIITEREWVLLGLIGEVLEVQYMQRTIRRLSLYFRSHKMLKHHSPLRCHQLFGMLFQHLSVFKIDGKQWHVPQNSHLSGLQLRKAWRKFVSGIKPSMKMMHTLYALVCIRSFHFI